MSILNEDQLLGAPAGSSQYQISRSLRFNSSDSASCARTFTSSGNRRTWTLSLWVKRSAIAFSAEQHIWGVTGATDATYGEMLFGTGDTLRFAVGYTTAYGITTTRVFRDPSAWYHIVLAFDATQSTATNKIKLYINGVEETTFSSDTRSSLANQDWGYNNNAAHYIGRNPNSDIRQFNGYLADCYLIDGQALTPSSFGQTDTNGEWQPIAYTGTYGTNGFKLSFSNNASTTTISQDSSGNNNHWTANNISVTAGAGNDSLVDTPTSTGTDTGVGGEVRGNYATLNPLDGNPAGLSNGNLDAASANAYPTIFPGSGQWYYEVNGTGYQWDGTRANWTPRAGSHNFGQRPFAYTAPSGFKALCDTNLPAPVVAKPNTVMDTVLYTGNGGTQTIIGLGFSPDLVWAKIRNNVGNHSLYDVIRGAGQRLTSSATNAEVTFSNSLTSFDSSGFSLGANTDGDVNASGSTYVAWCWDAGSSNVVNTQGSITSTVRANPSAGFSIVSYTGNGSAGATVGHGLNVVPQMLIVKRRDNGTLNWRVYHKDIGNTNVLYLSLTNASTADSAWNNTTPSSTVFTLGNDGAINVSGGTAIAYCFAPVAGYSSFSSYTGNGSTDGPFVYTGFRPRWVMIKATSGAQNWILKDTTRSVSNVAIETLLPNSSNAEIATAGNEIDVLSNGFKFRSTGGDYNTSSVTYIYAAFAESPFQYARAR